EGLPAVPTGPLSRPRLPLLRPRAGREHATDVCRGAARWDQGPRAAAGQGRLAAIALPSLFHADRAHGPGSRGTAASMARVVRPAHRPRARRAMGQPDEADPLLPDDGGCPRRRATGRPARLRGTALRGLPMRRLITPAARYLANLVRDLAEGWDRFWFTP